jgi:hypothetical protein
VKYNFKFKIGDVVKHKVGDECIYIQQTAFNSHTEQALYIVYTNTGCDYFMAESFEKFYEVKK